MTCMPDADPDALLRDALERALPGAGRHSDLSALTTHELDAGELLCEVGDSGHSAWVVVRGRIHASRIDGNGVEQRIGLHGPGELIGEAALLEVGVRRARMRAARRTELAVLDREWLISLMAAQPDVAMAIMHAVLTRGADDLGGPTEVVAFVPLDSTVMGEARALAAAAASIGQHVVIDPTDHPELEQAASAGTLGWLDDFEHRREDTETAGSRGVTLLGDPARPEWNRAIAKVADRLVFVLDTADGPDIGQAEQQLLESVPRAANAVRLLVLVHPADADRPRLTREWLVRRQVDRHLHLRRRTPSDLDRVARHAVGRPLTMAIGAGGVRSAGAVGTIQALADRGIAVDAVAGVSGGSIVAAWLGVLGAVDGLDEKTDWSMRKLLDYTLPVGAVIAGGRAWRRIQQACGDRDITDTWIPLSIATTDLTLGESVNHTTGPMADAIYASISIPGVFPPVDIDGHVHIDGAVFDAIPVEGARALTGEGSMIVVDLAPPHGRKTEPLPRVMSGPRLLARRLIPGMRSNRVPNPLDTLMRSTTVASASRRVEALGSVDCHVHLNLSEFSVLEFGKVRQVIALGATQSAALIDAFLAGAEPPVGDPTLIAALEAGRSRPRPTDTGPAPDRSPGAALIGSLSLAWADLRLRARRFVVAVAATSVVLALLLLMTGVVNQLNREPTVAVSSFGGSHWIVPAGADGIFTSSATFADSALADLGPVGADALGRVLIARYRLADAEGANDLDVILVGHADLPDDAPPLIDGRQAQGAAEVVVSEDSTFGVGDRVRLGPLDATVTGVVAETTVFAGMPLVFVPLDAARDLVVEGQPLLSALVVDQLPELPPTLRSLEPAEVAEDALGPIERPIATMRLVQVLLAVVASLIIGAVVFLATLDRLRDIAVLRAMGVASRPISIGVAAQALVIGLVASIIALIVQTLLAPVFPLRVYLDLGDRIVLVAVSMIVAAAASYGAIRRTLRTDPAAAFGGPGA